MSGIKSVNISESAFECRLCGHCCKGDGGIVVSDKDLERLSAYLGCTALDFTAKYGELRNGKLFIRSGENGYCLFFKENSGCAVHMAKPDICRAWPYFRGNLVDGGSFELAKDFCPGILREQSHSDFVRDGIAYLLAEKLVGNNRKDEAAALQVADIMETTSVD